MTTHGYTFGVCERCEHDRRLEPVAGEWLCSSCADKARPVPPIAGQLGLDGGPDAGKGSQIGPGDTWPEDFF